MIRFVFVASFPSLRLGKEATENLWDVLSNKMIVALIKLVVD
jgi:hypothetical protein